MKDYLEWFATVPDVAILKLQEKRLLEIKNRV